MRQPFHGQTEFIKDEVIKDEVIKDEVIFIQNLIRFPPKQKVGRGGRRAEGVCGPFIFGRTLDDPTLDDPVTLDDPTFFWK